MGKATWRAIREDNAFYVTMYRRGTLAILVSMGLNLLLIAFIVLVYSQEKVAEYYSSDGIRSPILLTPLDTPNRTSTWLLPPDPISEDENAKVVPD